MVSTTRVARERTGQYGGSRKRKVVSENIVHSRDVVQEDDSVAEF